MRIPKLEVVSPFDIARDDLTAISLSTSKLLGGEERKLPDEGGAYSPSSSAEHAPGARVNAPVRSRMPRRYPRLRPRSSPENGPYRTTQTRRWRHCAVLRSRSDPPHPGAGSSSRGVTVPGSGLESCAGGAVGGSGADCGRASRSGGRDRGAGARLAHEPLAGLRDSSLKYQNRPRSAVPQLRNVVTFGCLGSDPPPPKQKALAFCI